MYESRRRNVAVDTVDRHTVIIVFSTNYIFNWSQPEVSFHWNYTPQRRELHKVEGASPGGGTDSFLELFLLLRSDTGSVLKRQSGGFADL